MDILIWTLCILFLVTGLVGSVVPILPGTTLMLLAVLLQKWLLPETLTWSLVGWVAVFWLVSIVCDFVTTLIGTRLFGGTRWGMAGATGGAFAGMFFSLPMIILGTVLGAAVAEKWLAKRTYRQSMKAGAGAAVGFLLGTVARLGCAVIIVVLYAAAVYTHVPAAKV